MQCKEPIKPRDPRELKDPRDEEPSGRSRGTLAEGRKCHRVSFASKGREKRGTSREEEEGEARIQAEGRVRKKLR